MSCEDFKGTFLCEKSVHQIRDKTQKGSFLAVYRCCPDTHVSKCKWNLGDIQEPEPTFTILTFWKLMGMYPSWLSEAPGPNK